MGYEPGPEERFPTTTSGVQETTMFRSLTNLAVIAAVSLILNVIAVPVPAQEPAAFTGHWVGTLTIPGNPIVFIMDLACETGNWSGRVVFPTQNPSPLPLAGIEVRADSLFIQLPDVAGDPHWVGVLTEGEVVGTFYQSGGAFPFAMGRDELPPFPRPQEPQPPFPYDSEEVSYTNGEIILAGTLTTPPGDGPFPALLLISGSGSQDRNEEIFWHKPFLVLADHLTRAGIAVLRLDDRGVGGSSRGPSDVTSRDLAGDVRCGVRWLASHPAIDPARIGLLGHSEGGLIAPMVAAECDTVAFIILLAGTGVPGADILLEQTRLISAASFLNENFLDRQEEAQGSLFDLVLAGADSTAVYEGARRLIDTQLSRLPGEHGGLDPEAYEAQVRAAYAQVVHPWFRFFLAFDPRPVLRRVRCPVLALNGTLDLQVSVSQNLPEIQQALLEGGNQDVTIRSFDGLNHLFQTARSGLVTEYARIEETVAPQVLEVIREWILARFGPGAPDG